MHTLLNGVRDEEKKESIGKQKHKCLPLLITHVHNHAEHFAVTKTALPYASVWMIQLACGAVFATAYYKCAVPKHHLFMPCIGHRRRSASIIHASTVAEVLALSAAHFWPRDVQAAPSHSCHTTVSCISWMMLLGYFRQFYFFLFCIEKKQ